MDMEAMPTVAQAFHDLDKILRSGQYIPSSAPPRAELDRYREDIQLQLLQDTLRYCATSVPYYRQVWSSLKLAPSDVSNFTDLLRWPILHKENVRAGGSSFVTDAVKVRSYRCTSGTTSFRMPLPISREENEAIDQFGALRAAALGCTGDVPFVLRVLPPIRRLAAHAGGDGIGRSVTTFLNLDAADQRFDFDYVDHLIQCLIEEYPTSGAMERVNVLATCPTFMVRTITESLKKRNFDPQSTAVQHLVCSGGVLTEPLCKSIEDYWGAPLNAFYSLAEVAGSHPRSRSTGEYKFDLYAHAEILHPESAMPVEEGEEGILVLTSLYPFQQAQPMIRYWTGDVFTKRCGIGPGRIMAMVGLFRGRHHECVDTSLVSHSLLRPRLFGTADVLEVLHACPELPQFHKHPRFRLGIQGQKKPAYLTLRVEAFPMSVNAEHKLMRKIREGLALRLVAADGGHLDEGYVRVELVRKGALGNTNYIAYPDR